MREFHARERNDRGAKGLERKHRRAAALDRSMVLLDDVVEITATAYDHGLPAGILLPQQAQRPVTCRIAVEIHLTGPPWLMGLQGLAEEGSHSQLAAIRAQQGIDGLAVLIDGPVEVVSTAPYRDRRLVHPPG